MCDCVARVVFVDLDRSLQPRERNQMSDVVELTEQELQALLMQARYGKTETGEARPETGDQS